MGGFRSGVEVGEEAERLGGEVRRGRRSWGRENQREREKKRKERKRARWRLSEESEGKRERDKKERRGEVTGRGRMNFRVFTENYKRDISSLVPINFMALMIPTERHKKVLC